MAKNIVVRSFEALVNIFWSKKAPVMVSVANAIEAPKADIASVVIDINTPKADMLPLPEDKKGSPASIGSLPKAKRRVKKASKGKQKNTKDYGWLTFVDGVCVPNKWDDINYLTSVGLRYGIQFADMQDIVQQARMLDLEWNYLSDGSRVLSKTITFSMAAKKWRSDAAEENKNAKKYFDYMKKTNKLIGGNNFENIEDGFKEFLYNRCSEDSIRNQKIKLIYKLETEYDLSMEDKYKVSRLARGMYDRYKGYLNSLVQIYLDKK